MKKVFLGVFLLLLGSCDRPLIRPKGSDTQWQQRQEQLKHDQEQAQEQQDREVRVHHDKGSIDPIQLNPANN